MEDPSSFRKAQLLTAEAVDWSTQLFIRTINNPQARWSNLYSLIIISSRRRSQPRRRNVFIDGKTALHPSSVWTRPTLCTPCP